jgi:RNA polymerase sigma factor (sigma-70 family)
LAAKLLDQYFLRSRYPFTPIMPKLSRSLLHELFLKHATEISAYIRKRGSDEQDVADILQESFVRLSQYPDAETIQNHRAFLFQTASNIAVDSYRRGAVRSLHAEPEADVEFVSDTSMSPQRYWEAQESLDQFNHWLEELPELQRHAFVLHSIEGCTYAEIAVRLNISVSSVERYSKSAMLHISQRFSKAER